MLFGVPLGRSNLAQVQIGWTRHLHSPDVALWWEHSFATEGGEMEVCRCALNVPQRAQGKAEVWAVLSLYKAPLAPAPWTGTIQRA